MCPGKENDTPRITHDGMEGSDENWQNIEQDHGADVIFSSDSGSDEEADTLAAQGYISLAQSEDDVNTVNEIDQAERQSHTELNDEKPMVAPQDFEENKTDHGEFPPSSSLAFSSTQNSQMGEEEINLIKSVMLNVQLPSSAIPEWAKKIPEEKWKAPLVSALQGKTSRNNESTETGCNSSKTM